MNIDTETPLKESFNDNLENNLPLNGSSPVTVNLSASFKAKEVPNNL